MNPQKIDYHRPDTDKRRGARWWDNVIFAIALVLILWLVVLVVLHFVGAL